MSDREHICAGAPGIAALAPDDPERLAAVSHARGCAECARALREAERLQALLAAVEPEPLPAGALERAAREIEAALRREERRRFAAAVAAISASLLVLVGFARTRSTAPADVALAGGLWALAIVVAAAATRRPILAIALAVGASLAALIASGGPGPLAPSLGMECLATELGSAAVVVAAAWLAIRGGTTSPARAAVAAAAAAGALAGDAALQLTCAAHAAAPHLLAFHVGGVLLAAAAASLAWRPPRAAAI